MIEVRPVAEKETEQLYPEQSLECKKCGYITEKETSAFQANYCEKCGTKF